MPTWDQTADFEEGNDSDFDGVFPAWDKEADFEDTIAALPTDFDAAAPAWDKYTNCETTTPFGFDSVTDADGDFQRTLGAAHDGSYGIRVTFDDANAAYGTLAFGSIDQTSFCYSMWFSRQATALDDGTVLDIMRAFNGPGDLMWILRLGRSGADYSITAYAREDDANYVNLSAVNIDTGWHHIVLMGTRSTAPGANNGTGYLYVDGVLVGSSITLDNDTRDWDYVRVGMTLTNSASFSGTFFMDEVYLDPVGAVMQNTLATSPLGSYGLAYPVHDADTSIFPSISDPIADTFGVVDFWFDPNSLTMGDADGLIMCVMADGSIVGGQSWDAYVSFWRTDALGYYLAFHDVEDDGSQAAGGTTVVSDGPHYVRLIWSAATAPGANNGYFLAYVDGQLVYSSTGRDNDLKNLDDIFLTTMSVSAGVHGIMYMDDLKWTNGPGAPPWIIPAAANEGNYGMAITLFGETDNEWGSLTDPTAETPFTMECWLNPNGLTMATDDLFAFMTDASNLSVRLSYDGSNYQLSMTSLNDSAGTDISPFTNLTDAWHHIRATYRASSGADDGVCNLFVDNVLVSSLTGLDNDTKSIDQVYIGVLNPDAGTSGAFYIDVGRHANELAPHSGRPQGQSIFW